jgi:hypothetical protein
MLCVRRTLREVAAGPKSGFQMNLAQLSASGGFLHLKPLGHWHRTGTTMGDIKGGSWMKTTQNGTQSVACSQDSNYLVFFVFEVWFAPLWGQPRHAHNRLETVVEKEIKQSPQQRMSAEGMDPNSMEASGLAAQGSHLGGWRWIDVDWCRLMSIDVDCGEELMRIDVTDADWTLNCWGPGHQAHEQKTPREVTSQVWARVSWTIFAPSGSIYHYVTMSWTLVEWKAWRLSQYFWKVSKPNIRKY